MALATLHPRLELGSNEAIKQAILAGLGISALSSHALALNQPGQFAVLDVDGFPILRHWYAVYPAGRQLSVVARAFLNYLLGRGGSGTCCGGEEDLTEKTGPGRNRPNAIMRRRSRTAFRR